MPLAKMLSRAGWALTVMPDQWPPGVARVVVHFYAENADGLRAAIGVRTIQR